MICTTYFLTFFSELIPPTGKDNDFDYLQGCESTKMYHIAFDLYSINLQRLMRYARRRSIGKGVEGLIYSLNE